MVVSDHNQPRKCITLALLGYKIKAFDVRTTEMKKSLYGYYMGYICYFCALGLIATRVPPHTYIPTFNMESTSHFIILI